MRVCHVISGIDVDNGGPPAALGGLAAAQVRAGMTVSVLTSFRFEQSHDVAKDWRGKGISVRLVGPAKEPMSRHPGLYPAALEMAQAHDVLHVHSMWEEIQHQGCRAAQKAGTPYVMTPHGMLDSWNLTQRGLKKRLYLALRMKKHLNRAAAIHCATEIEREHVGKLKLRPEIFVEPHGLDLSEFERLPEKGEFRAKYPALTDRPFVLFLGRIDRAKGLELLVPAIARMRVKAPLVVVGPDWNNMRAWTEAEAARLAISDRVIFTGMLRGREKIAALVDAAVLALPSYHENFGIVVAEALAAGTPVVVSDQVYLHPEVTGAGVGGVVRMDVDELTSELDRWMWDEALRAQAGRRARPWAMEKFNWDVIAQHWKDHYQRAAATRRAASVGS